MESTALILDTKFGQMLHYIKDFWGGCSKNFKDHRTQQAKQAAI